LVRSKAISQTGVLSYKRPVVNETILAELSTVNGGLAEQLKWLFEGK
jgi:hypothetical protein